MGRDVAARGALAVARHPPEGPLRAARAAGCRRRRQAVERAQVAAGDPDQRDQVVAVPDAVAVGLAEADAAAEHRAIEAGRVDLERRREIGVRRRRSVRRLPSGSISSRLPPRIRRTRRGKAPAGATRSRSSPAAYARGTPARREEIGEWRLPLSHDQGQGLRHDESRRRRARGEPRRLGDRADPPSATARASSRPDVAEEIGAALKRRCEIAGVFVNSTLDEVIDAAERENLTLLQFHGEEGPSFCVEARRRTGRQGDQGDAGQRAPPTSRRPRRSAPTSISSTPTGTASTAAPARASTGTWSRSGARRCRWSWRAA